jgi:hypothetical protein
MSNTDDNKQTSHFNANGYSCKLMHHIYLALQCGGSRITQTGVEQEVRKKKKEALVYL